MKFPTTHPADRPPLASGFTLVEVMVAMAVATLLFGSIVALGMYTARSFNMIGNYVDLDAQSRNTADVLGREIRDSSDLIAFSTNNPAYLKLTNDTIGQSITITYYKDHSTLVLSKAGATTKTTQTLLTHCDSWTFSLFNRAPDITSDSISFYAATNANTCKVINMSWRCSRTIFGSPLTTVSVQTAQIMLRNKMVE